jgi:hypothetical protein
VALKVYACSLGNASNQLGDIACNAHEVEGSHCIRTGREGCTGRDESRGKEAQGLVADLDMKGQRIVAACADGFGRAQGVTIFNGCVDRRLIGESDKRLGENAADGVFEEERFGVAER